MKSKDDTLLQEAYSKILMKENEMAEQKTGSREISKEDIDQLIDTCKETGMDPRDFGQHPLLAGKLKDFSQLYNLQNQKAIEEYIVEYLVGFGIIKLVPGQRLTYKGLDLTDAYEEAYGRYNEDEGEY
jgi:hypothetical protein